MFVRTHSVLKILVFGFVVVCSFANIVGFFVFPTANTPQIPSLATPFKSSMLFDVIFAFGILFLFLALSRLIHRYVRSQWLKAFLQATVFVTIFFPLYCTVVCLFSQWRVISSEEFFLIFQSNPIEAATYLSHLKYFSVHVGIFLFFWFCHVYRCTRKPCLPEAPYSTHIILGILLLAIALLGISVQKSYLYKQHRYAKKEFSVLCLPRNLDLSKLTASYPSKLNGTVLYVIIGESDTRLHWSLYGYPKKTTPNVESMLKQYERSGFIRYAYAADKRTFTSLAYALTESRQYTKTPSFRDAYSIVDILNKAGIDTYWISNQHIHKAEKDTYNQIGKTCKFHFWYEAAPHYLERLDRPFDTVLYPKLESLQFDKRRPSVVFVHTYGAHEPYENRYAHGKKYDANPEASYDKAISQIDVFLKHIDKIAKKDNASWIYFSDHGEAPGIGRNHNHPLMYKIPFVYNFTRTSPAIESFISNSRNDLPFSNDLLHDTLVGLLEIKTNKSNADYDYCSTNFVLRNISDIRVRNGTYTITKTGGISKIWF